MIILGREAEAHGEGSVTCYFFGGAGFIFLFIIFFFQNFQRPVPLPVAEIFGLLPFCDFFF